MLAMRFCPVCGAKITGRSDKIYCSESCRVHSNNEKRKAIGDDITKARLSGIQKDLAAIAGNGGKRYIKIMGLITRLSKILYTFEW